MLSNQVKNAIVKDMNNTELAVYNDTLLNGVSRMVSIAKEYSVIRDSGKLYHAYKRVVLTSEFNNLYSNFEAAKAFSTEEQYQDFFRVVEESIINPFKNNTFISVSSVEDSSNSILSLFPDLDVIAVENITPEDRES